MDINYSGKILSDVTILELQSLLKVYTFQGKAWMVNCSQCGSIRPQLEEQQLAVLPPPNMKQATVCVFLKQLVHTLWKSGWAKRPYPPATGDLGSDRCSWSQRCRQRWEAMVEAPTPLAEVKTRRLEGLVPFFYPCIFSSWKEIKNLNIQNQLHIQK